METNRLTDNSSGSVTVDESVNVQNSSGSVTVDEESNMQDLSVEKNAKKSIGGEKVGWFKSLRGKSIMRSVIRCIVLGITLVAFFLAGFFTFYITYDKDLQSMFFVYKTYKNHYYFNNENEIPAKVLTEGLMDIYSEYYTPDEYKANREESNGERKGYGISFEGLKIYRVCGNSPAEKAGLTKGGEIVGYKINDGERKTPSDLNELSTAIKTLSDKDELTLYVDYNGNVSEHSMVKADYRESYVYYTDDTGCYRFTDDSGSMLLERFADNDLSLGDEWGYVRYVSFYGLENNNYGSVRQFVCALDKMLANGKRKVIIDLRNNGGGYMPIMCSMSGVLCPQINESGTTTRRVAQVAEYKGGKKSYFNVNDDYAKNADGEYYTDKLEKIVFLANAGSASASEALIGCVLDYDEQSGRNKVKVVLEPHTDAKGNTIYRTYGKGIMQTTFVNDNNGEALKLTTARIIWPLSEKCIHGVGITAETDSRVLNATGDPVIFAQDVAS